MDGMEEQWSWDISAGLKDERPTSNVQVSEDSDIECRMANFTGAVIPLIHYSPADIGGMSEVN